MRIGRKFLILAGLAPLLAFGAAAGKTLDFYTIDVEGGKSVLVVSPKGESMLLDAGWPAGGNREASTERIVAALKTAGVKQLDYLVISHFDIDHLGDVPALAERIPIRHILDHGQIQFPAGGATSSPRFNTYVELRQKMGHTVLKPGDKVPLKDVDIEVVTSAGQLLAKPLMAPGPRTHCARAIRGRRRSIATWRTTNRSVCCSGSASSACWIWRTWKRPSVMIWCVP